ncbi:MAG: hypothetical protein DMG98_06670 [Acidobacteria bacterium]|nr:MAG: hypothetical protein DMG98_06670 [Acidobacteriota bacterium]
MLQFAQAQERAKKSVRQLRAFIARLGAAVLAVPVVLMIHEFGHLLMAIILGFHNVRLHYESVSYADQNLFWGLIQSGAKAQAAAVSPFWKVAVMEIAGPLPRWRHCSSRPDGFGAFGSLP